MNSNRNRDRVLALIGLGAVLAYVLACTSFSPDDSKVLYPAFDTRGGGLALAVFDRDARRTDPLLLLPGPADKSRLLRGLWTPDGSRVVALWPAEGSGDSEQLNVLVLPYKTRQPARWLTLPVNQERSAVLALPPAVVGSSLFLGVESLVFRLDLETGALHTNEIDGDLVLLGQGDRVCYLREKDSDDPSEDKVYEFGRLDPKTLALSPLFSVAKKPNEDIYGFFAVSRDGSRTALLCERSDENFFLVYEGKELIKTIPAPASDQEFHVGNFLFSPDGATLYATFAKSPAETEKEKFAQQCGIVELPLSGAASREIPLFQVQEEWDDEEIFLFQLDLSHDGKTLALCSTCLVVEDLDRLEPEDLALYLVDLTRPDRKVTKVAIAPPPVPKEQ